jgi:hypothetical protein
MKTINKKHESVRTSISMPEKLYSAAARRMHELGYNDFSSYLQDLMRRDADMMPGGVMRETPPPYKVN